MLTCVKEGIHALLPCLPTTLNEPKRHEQFIFNISHNTFKKLFTSGRDGSLAKALKTEGSQLEFNPRNY